MLGIDSYNRLCKTWEEYRFINEYKKGRKCSLEGIIRALNRVQIGFYCNISTELLEAGKTKEKKKKELAVLVLGKNRLG